MEQVTTIRNTLGECPVWSAEKKTLYWMDLIERILYAVTPENGNVQSWTMPEYLGGLALREKGGLVLGMQHKIVGFDPASGEMEELFVFPVKREEGIRFNDGKCDAFGRFLIGNMKDENLASDGDKDMENAGSIYMLGPDGSFREVETNVTIPNGLTWSLDGTILYLADSHEHTVYAYDYNEKTGDLGKKSTFAVISEDDGVPDGSCLDEKGFLWTAINGGGKIARYTPEGELDREITLPVSMPTSVAFGGDNLDTLYITTATQGMSDDELREQPLAGTILAVKPGVCGAPVYNFKG